MANDYGLMWMNPNHMMPEGVGMQGPNEMMTMDPNTQMDSSFYQLPISQPFETVAQAPMELDSFLMMDDFDGDNDCCDEPPRYMTAATQTIPNLRKKIRPIAHPGLKLQTPIAFKSDSDLDAIPIARDGMAICEKCGAMGVKHAFYTRHRNYCSLSCARSMIDKENDETSPDDSQCYDFKFTNGCDLQEKVEEKVQDNLPCPTPDNYSLPGINLCQKPGPFPFTLELPEEQAPEPLAKKDPPCAIWMPYFKDPNFTAAPVNCFKHAPMSDCWENIRVGMKVEVESHDSGEEKTKTVSDSIWVATVLKLAGYHALLRYEGYEADKDFWVNLCCSNVHPVGKNATRGKPLIPPKLIAEQRKDWKDFLVERLTGTFTLPLNFHARVGENLKSRFRVGLQLEVLDKDNVLRMSLATIRQIVGKRLHVTYYNAGPECGGFWFHEDSPLIHPIGWSVRVGIELNAPELYLERCENGIMDKDDASEELFTAPFQSVTDWNETVVFEKGMKLEASDPLNPIAISAATVTKILADGYLIIGIDSYKEPVTYFCYHSQSPLIFPAGFCRDNGITLSPPHGYAADKFSWDSYVKETGCLLAPASNFNTKIPDHGLLPGMQLEAADIMMPQDLNVATIALTVGRLLKIHFDGWTDDYDQWMDCSSPDIYPVGWCGLNSYTLNCPPKAVKGSEKKKPGRRCKKVKGKVKSPLAKKQSVDIKDEEMQGSSSNNTFSAGENDGESFEFLSESTHSPDESSDVPLSTFVSNAFIPRLGVGSCSDGDLDPSAWNCYDVVTFLRLNDCGDYAENFLAQKKTGSDLLNLTEETLMDLTGKTGPTVKIFDLIKQLKQLLRVRAGKASRRIRF